MSKLNSVKFILLTALFFVASIGFIRSSFSVLKSKGRLDEVQRQVADLQKQKEQLERDVSYKQTNEYVEEKARDDLNLIKPRRAGLCVSG